jgi:thiol-disulfide isomerase/thioredoxin
MSLTRGPGRSGPLLVFAAALALAPRSAGASDDAGLLTVPLARTVANVEFERLTLLKAATPRGTRAPVMEGEGWFGAIVRRLAADPPASASHFVPFAVEYESGRPVRAWCDQDLDGDLGDEPPVTLDAYPVLAGARSFLARLRWPAVTGDRATEIERTVRVVLEAKAPGDPNDRPRARLQSVFAMTGTARFGSEETALFAYDGDGDGLYTRSLDDGVFVDTDRDRHFVVDEMGPEFGSFVVPVNAGGRAWLIAALDPEGKSVTLRDAGPSRPRPPAPSVGGAAPDFSFTATDGREVRLASFRGRPVLIYFWMSGCGACRHQADRLANLYARFHPRGLEILGVSYDTDHAAAEAFRASHRQTWPTSISGRAVWEDPVGFLYRERGTGVLYLVDAAGTLALVTSDLDALEKAVAERFDASAAQPAGGR